LRAIRRVPGGSAERYETLKALVGGPEIPEQNPEHPVAIQRVASRLGNDEVVTRPGA